MGVNSFEEYREKSLEKAKSSGLPSFRYGLSINVEPSDFRFEDFLDFEPKRKDLDVPKEFFLETFEMFNGKLDYLCQAKGEVYYLDEDFLEVSDKLLQVFVLVDSDREINLVVESDISLIKVLVKQGCRVKINVLRNSGEKNSFSKVVMVQEKDSKVELNKIIFGSKYARDENYSVLSGDGSECEQRILFLSKGEERFDIYTCSVHEGKETKSDLLTRGVLKGNSKVLERGLVKIKQNASNSKGYEKQDALVLDNAEADAVPNLEINNHDVKCSHGTSIGRIDEDVLYYLMSRGLSEEDAKNEIIMGYFEPILKNFKEKDFKDKLFGVLDG